MSVSQTTILDRCIVGFQHFGAFVPQTADFDSFMANFQQHALSTRRLMFWQFITTFQCQRKLLTIWSSCLANIWYLVWDVKRKVRLSKVSTSFRFSFTFRIDAILDSRLSSKFSSIFSFNLNSRLDFKFWQPYNFMFQIKLQIYFQIGYQIQFQIRFQMQLFTSANWNLQKAIGKLQF